MRPRPWHLVKVWSAAVRRQLPSLSAICRPDSTAWLLSDEQDTDESARFLRYLWTQAGVCRFISFEGLKEALSDMEDVVRYLKVDWLQEISESCAVEAD
jgi:hypothetical protein